jgi:hypothetical protein
MAAIGYPQTCISLHCGRICCDGCRFRPDLEAFHASRGRRAEYEAHQDSARALVAQWAEERRKDPGADAVSKGRGL